MLMPNSIRASGSQARSVSPEDARSAGVVDFRLVDIGIGEFAKGNDAGQRQDLFELEAEALLGPPDHGGESIQRLRLYYHTVARAQRSPANHNPRAMLRKVFEHAFFMALQQYGLRRNI